MEGGRGRSSLPGAEAAFIESARLTDYLLNPDHPVGGDKAAFLKCFGFRRETWPVLEAVLLAHARSGLVVGERQTAYGHHYTVEDPLPTPDGRNPVVRPARC
ncbi:MAG: hypothetical protein IT306_10345 [Chloroflexi bacterium]|nr:hypothetical protein [Chloroflexota bacterium]